jgi:hypothetical protein
VTLASLAEVLRRSSQSLQANYLEWVTTDFLQVLSSSPFIDHTITEGYTVSTLKALLNKQKSYLYKIADYLNVTEPF